MNYNMVDCIIGDENTNVILGSLKSEHGFRDCVLIEDELVSVNNIIYHDPVSLYIKKTVDTVIVWSCPSYYISVKDGIVKGLLSGTMTRSFVSFDASLDGAKMCWLTDNRHLSIVTSEKSENVELKSSVVG